MEISYHEQDLPIVAERILSFLPKTQGASIIGLSGDLGAGKTTLVQAIGRSLGVTDTIISPTFVLMKRYQTANDRFKTLLHIDAYRLLDEDISVLKIENEYTNPETLIIIEWCEYVDIPVTMKGYIAQSEQGRIIRII